jgi:DNA mismatch repair ATPase MutS
MLEKIKDKVAAEKGYVFVNDGVQAALRVFNQLRGFLESIKPMVSGSPLGHEYQRLIQIREQTDMGNIANINTNDYIRFSLDRLSELDISIRFRNRELILELLELISELDVYITIGEIAVKHKFSFAKALPKEQMQLSYSGVYHPGIANAVRNDVEIEPDKNVVFLTGANMAGKSTLMKSLGITLYLAHIGLPVPAKSFEFSVCDGIYTSINLADNLFAGASHYYAEVLRLKEVAVELARGKRLFVVFDELFRGTNVKDAYDGTVAVTKAFAAYKDCSFIISTHIIEAGDELKKEELPIQYQYLPTVMNGEVPEYPRVLKSGITSDRQGMLIIKNEKILDLLDEGIASLKPKVPGKEEETCLL